MVGFLASKLLYFYNTFICIPNPPHSEATSRPPHVATMPHPRRSVDRSSHPPYTTSMDTTAPTKTAARKKRSDRNHIIYELIVNGLNYIGVTAKTESTVLRSVQVRANKHWYRAQRENKDWSLCVALRELSSKEQIEIRVHEIVRGKAAAHRREVELRRMIKPVLNTDTRGD